jgi:hypothetical protein
MVLAAQELDAERSDLLAMLGKQRYFLRYTTRDLTDEQARRRTTVSELTLGGLIKHVALVERNWARFIVEGPHERSDASAWRASWPTTTRPRRPPTSSRRRYPTWARRSRCRARRGSPPGSAGRRGGC